MIAVKLQGRLGNQLFQYAFIYSLSRKLATKFYLDKSIETFILPKYMNVNMDSLGLLDKHIFTITGYKHFFSHHLRKLFYTFLKKLLRLKETAFANDKLPQELLKGVQNHTYYQGFFHSEDYFFGNGTQIRKLFSIKNIFKQEFDRIFSSLPFRGQLITLHLRRGDYVGLGLTLPLDYYHSAINLIQSSDNYYIIISDDPDFAEHEFRYLHNKYISRHSEIIDLQFLMNADICILSNSSFSWWGAYLNTKNPRVIVPKYWSGYREQKEFPTGTILEGWEQLDLSLR